MLQPKASTPHMPGYEDMAAGNPNLLPWEWALERLRDSHNYWLTTVRPDGRPHVMPIWGLWFEDAFWFSTGGNSRKAKNMAANPEVVIANEDAANAVVLEGRIEVSDDRDAIRRMFPVYEAKYGWQLTEDFSPYWVVRPRVVFGIPENSAGAPGAMTRWRFEA